MGYILRRRRLQDGSFGELEKVFNGETDEEKFGRLDEYSNQLKSDNEMAMAAILEIYEVIGGDAK